MCDRTPTYAPNKLLGKITGYHIPVKVKWVSFPTPTPSHHAPKY